MNIRGFGACRASSIAIVLLFLFGPFGLGGTAACAQEVPYPVKTSELPGAPGTLIRQAPTFGAPDGASAYRIVYRSIGLHGEPIAVSGMVVIPPGSPPPGGRPIVAWAHPTTGIIPRCAPSMARVRFQMIQGLRNMVGRGYVVAATDYPGLGTEGPHPYLVGVSEARAVLDSVRAARMLPGAGNGRRFAVWGHSQGGHAALFTGLLARSYAPDLQLVGIAVAAPATELGPLLEADIDTPGGRNIAAMTLWSWQLVFDAPMSKVVVPAAVPVIDALARECLESIYDIIVRQHTTRALAKGFLSVKNVTDAEPWASLLTKNTPGALPPDIPVFISQGTSDTIVIPAITDRYIHRLCDSGSPVSIDIMQGVGHGFIAMRSADAAVSWMADRFAGKPAPNDCDRHGAEAKGGAPPP